MLTKRERERTKHQKNPFFFECRVSQEIRMTVKPSVSNWIKSQRRIPQESNGSVLDRVFCNLADIEEIYKGNLDEVRRRIYSPHLFEASIKARVNRQFKFPEGWARIMAQGVSQGQIDFMRKVFPAVIPGHDQINGAKVPPISPREQI